MNETFHKGIAGGVSCAECGAIVTEAWVRECDNRATCEPCAARSVNRIGHYDLAWDQALTENARRNVPPEVANPAAFSTAPKRVKRERPKSRATRWAEACAAARTALDAMGEAKDDFESAMSELDGIRQEFEEWHDALDGRFEGSPLVEKLETVKDLTTEVEIDLSEAETALDEAEGADLPLGFGRD